MEVSNEMLAKLFVPLAFIVTVTEAAVEINDAKITSGSHLKVNTESTVGIKTTATTGKLPVALSVAVAVNDSHITVGGKSNIKAEGDIELISKAVTAADAKASRGNAATSTGAGTAGSSIPNNVSAYIAVEAAVQDGEVKITDQASVEAGGDITLSSAADLSGSAVATSALPPTPAGGAGASGEEENSTGSGLAAVKTLLKDISLKLFRDTGSRLAARIHGVAEYIAGKTYKVRLKKGEKTLDSLEIEGIVVTDSPGSFEPR